MADFISIERNAGVLEVTLRNGEDSRGAVLNPVLLKWNANDELFAGLLAERLRGQLEAMLKKVRKEAYEAGWEHAKGKRIPKQTWFSGMQP